MVDVLIVGAGPAGLAAARALTARGATVDVIEKRQGPQDKVCGEGLMPIGLRHLRQLGVNLDEGLPFRGIRYCQGSLCAEADFAEGPGRAIRRLVLSSALRERLNISEGEAIRAALPIRDGWEVETTHRRRRARLLVAADGLHSPTRRLLGWPVRSGPLQRWGWRQHFATAPWTDRVEVWFGKSSEAYVTPIAPDTLNVAVLSEKGKQRENWLEDFPALRERLGSPAGELRALGPLWQRVGSAKQPRVALIGDAAGYLDACTGEGMSLAFHEALALGAAWERGGPSLPGYSQALRSITLPYQVLTAAALMIGRHPTLTRLTIHLLRRRPAFFQELLSLNQGLGHPLTALARLAGWPAPLLPAAP